MYIVTVDQEKCDGCEGCSNICPSEVFRIADGKSDPHQAEECLYCLSCVEACPSSSITVSEV